MTEWLNLGCQKISKLEWLFQGGFFGFAFGAYYSIYDTLCISYTILITNKVHKTDKEVFKSQVRTFFQEYSVCIQTNT